MSNGNDLTRTDQLKIRALHEAIELYESGKLSRGATVLSTADLLYAWLVK